MAVSETQYWANVNLISRQQMGSDIYGVLEKAAYNLHQREPKRSATDNWFSAQIDLARYEVPLNFDRPGFRPQCVPLSEESLHAYLQKSAYHQKNFWGKITELEAWNMALLMTANQVSTPSLAQHLRNLKEEHHLV
jgi:hypothetical protein